MRVVALPGSACVFLMSVGDQFTSVDVMGLIERGKREKDGMG